MVTSLLLASVSEIFKSARARFSLKSSPAAFFPPLYKYITWFWLKLTVGILLSVGGIWTNLLTISSKLN